jgi:hypothetical protein
MGVPDAGQSAGNYARLMRLLSAELRGRGKLLTAAVSAPDHTGGIKAEVFGHVSDSTWVH